MIQFKVWDDVTCLLAPMVSFVFVLKWMSVYFSIGKMCEMAGLWRSNFSCAWLAIGEFIPVVVHCYQWYDWYQKKWLWECWWNASLKRNVKRVISYCTWLSIKGSSIGPLVHPAPLNDWFQKKWRSCLFRQLAKFISLCTVRYVIGMLYQLGIAG